ncbi:hypothetical protein F2P79_001515 [Pimephales promelas]|nr:hypothetical protein F2P79_001515 [Pimephales promelas]
MSENILPPGVRVVVADQAAQDCRISSSSLMNSILSTQCLAASSAQRVLLLEQQTHIRRAYANASLSISNERIDDSKPDKESS